MAIYTLRYTTILGPVDSVEELHSTATALANGELPSGWELVASSVFARVAWQPERGIFYKEFLPRGPLERLKAMLRGSRATRARENGDKLSAAGFSAPENLAWGPLPGGREYLFTRAVEGDGVTVWLRKHLAGRSPGELLRRRRLLRDLGSFIGKLHNAGFIHGDLRPGNVLASEIEEQFRFSLIDNERNTRALPPAEKGLRKNLMQLNMLVPSDLTRSDRWRFFLAWREQMDTLADRQARALAITAYQWAMRRLSARGDL
jgi:hypothetical protein